MSSFARWAGERAAVGVRAIGVEGDVGSGDVEDVGVDDEEDGKREKSEVKMEDLEDDWGDGYGDG